MLLLGSFSEGLGAFGSFTLEKYFKSCTDPALAEIILNTVLFILGSALVAILLALFLAYLNTRTDIPFKFLFRILSIVPMMIPHILFAVSWALLLNPTNGLINLLLKELFNLQKSHFNIYSLPGMFLVEGLLDLPIAYLVIAPAMSSFDVSLEESSRVSGGSTLKTLRRITLPILRPAILASFTLVIVRSLASFAVPSTIGIPGRIYLLSTHIYRIIATGFATDYGMAAEVGMSALVASLTLIYVYRHLTSESEKFVTVSSRGYRPLTRAFIQLHSHLEESSRVCGVGTFYTQSCSMTGELRRFVQRTTRERDCLQESDPGAGARQEAGRVAASKGSGIGEGEEGDRAGEMGIIFLHEKYPVIKSK